MASELFGAVVGCATAAARTDQEGIGIGETRGRGRPRRAPAVTTNPRISVRSPWRDTALVPYPLLRSEPRFDSKADQIGSRVQTKPVHQDRAVHLDRFLRQSEFAGNLLVEQAVGDMLEHLALTR